jgi:hypothetical protein
LTKYSHESLGLERTYDLRTLGATIHARETANAMNAPTTAKEFRDQRFEVADSTSKRLCDSRNIALNSYINPDVFKGWYNGLPEKEQAIVDAKKWWPKR